MREAIHDVGKSTFRRATVFDLSEEVSVAPAPSPPHRTDDDIEAVFMYGLDGEMMYAVPPMSETAPFVEVERVRRPTAHCGTVLDSQRTAGAVEYIIAAQRLRGGAESDIDSDDGAMSGVIVSDGGGSGSGDVVNLGLDDSRAMQGDAVMAAVGHPGDGVAARTGQPPMREERGNPTHRMYFDDEGNHVTTIVDATDKGPHDARVCDARSPLRPHVPVAAQAGDSCRAVRTSTVRLYPMRVVTGWIP